MLIFKVAHAYFREFVPKKTLIKSKLLTLTILHL